jgi:molybdopterin-guanine dinucleotide biosynthesis protein A
MINSRITGVILAGGKSSRMGVDKALLRLDGRPFIAHVAATLQAIFDRVILMTNDASAYRFLGMESFEDIYRDRGPLGGIHSALLHADGANIFVSACDTPFISRELVTFLAAYPTTAPAAIAHMHEQIHPLCGIYTHQCLQTATEQLEAGQYRVLDFADKIGATIIPITPDLSFYKDNLLSNFNTPEDYPPDTNNS